MSIPDTSARAGWLAALLWLPGLAGAAEPLPPQPKIELGIGGLGMILPDYRGSDRYGTRFLPIPYVVYRSERVQVTREGIRARLFALERVTASFSGAGSLPGTDDNPDRAGMPAIEPTFELGPAIDVLLDEAPGQKLRLRLPVRFITAVDDFEFSDVGQVFAPHLRLDLTDRHGDWSLLHLFTVGAQWATEDHHEYFYGVEPQFATPWRPAFDAAGGYSGARATLSTAVQRDRWRVGLFASWDWLDGAAFAGSPLLKEDHSVTSGLYFTYRLYRSGPERRLDNEVP